MNNFPLNINKHGCQTSLVNEKDQYHAIICINYNTDINDDYDEENQNKIYLIGYIK